MKKFMVLLGVALLGTLLSGCGFHYIRESGKTATETRAASGFDRVELNGYGEVILVQGDTESVEVEADENYLPYIETKVSGGTLHLGI